MPSLGDVTPISIVSELPGNPRLARRCHLQHSVVSLPLQLTCWTRRAEGLLELRNHGRCVSGSFLGFIVELVAMALARWQIAEGVLRITVLREVFENLEVLAPVQAFLRYLAEGTKEFDDHFEAGGRFRRKEHLLCNAAQLVIALAGVCQIFVFCPHLLVFPLPLQEKSVIIEQPLSVLCDRRNPQGQSLGICFRRQRLSCFSVALQFEKIGLDFLKLHPPFHRAVYRIQLERSEEHT